MKNLDITTLNGALNLEPRIDGGIGLYYETNFITLMLNRDQMIEVAAWLVTYIEATKE